MEEKNLVSKDDFRLKYLQRFMGLSEEEGRHLVSVLTAPTPTEPDELGKYIEERPGRGAKSFKYIPGFRFIQRFNEAFGFLWSFEIPKEWESDGQIVVKGRWSLQVPGRTVTRELPDGAKETLRFDGFSVIKEQYGSSEIKKWSSDGKDKQGNITHKKGSPLDLGDDYKGAATDSMKKCGLQLGMFMDLYGPRESQEEDKPSNTQIEAFYSRAEKAGMSSDEADAWALEKLGNSLEKAKGQELLGLTAELIDMARNNKSG